MTRHERQMTRIKAVYLLINKERVVTTKFLADEMGVHQRTIQRDLDVLRYNGLVQTNGRVWKATNKKVKNIA